MAFVNTYTVANTVNSTDNTIGLSGTDMRLFNFATIENSRKYFRVANTINSTIQVVQIGGVNTPLGIGNSDVDVDGDLSANALRVGDGVIAATELGGPQAIGFFATDAHVKITVLGSRGGNGALANLLDALATYGLITNNTTA